MPDLKGFESQEQPQVTKKQVIDSFSAHGKDHAPSMALLVQWIDQQSAVVRSIKEQGVYNRANIKFELEKAELYFNTGFWDEALGELEGDDGVNGIRDMAYIAKEKDLYDQTVALIEKIKAQQNSVDDLLDDTDVAPAE